MKLYLLSDFLQAPVDAAQAMAATRDAAQALEALGARFPDPPPAA